MLDGTEFFECACYSDEHTLKFTLDAQEREIYTSVYLSQYRPFWKRCWVALKYVFGYKCKYGHWDCFILRPEDVPRLRKLLDALAGPIVHVGPWKDGDGNVIERAAE